MIRSTLRTFYPQPLIEKALESLGLSSQIRPEQVSLELFLALFSQLRSE